MLLKRIHLSKNLWSFKPNLSGHGSSACFARHRVLFNHFLNIDTIGDFCLHKVKTNKNSKSWKNLAVQILIEFSFETHNNKLWEMRIIGALGEKGCLCITTDWWQWLKLQLAWKQTLRSYSITCKNGGLSHVLYSDWIFLHEKTRHPKLGNFLHQEAKTKSSRS